MECLREKVAPKVASRTRHAFHLLGESPNLFDWVSGVLLHVDGMSTLVQRTFSTGIVSASGIPTRDKDCPPLFTVGSSTLEFFWKPK